MGKTVLTTFIAALAMIGFSTSARTQEALDAPHLVLKSYAWEEFFITKNDEHLHLIISACYGNTKKAEEPKFNIIPIDTDSETDKAAKYIFNNLNKINQVENLSGPALIYHIQYRAGKQLEAKNTLTLDQKAPEVIKLYGVLSPLIEQQEILSYKNPDCRITKMNERPCGVCTKF